MKSLMDFLHTTHQGNLTKKGYTPSEKGNSHSNEGIQSLGIPLSFLSKINKGEKEEVVTMNDTENKANGSSSNSLIIPLTFIPSGMASSTSDASKDDMVKASHVETGTVDDSVHVPNENASVEAINDDSDTLSVAIPLKFIHNGSKLKGTVNSDHVDREQVIEISQSSVEGPNVSSSQVSVITSTSTSSEGEPSDKTPVPTGSHSSIDIPIAFLSNSKKNSSLQK